MTDSDPIVALLRQIANARASLTNMSQPTINECHNMSEFILELLLDVKNTIPKLNSSDKVRLKGACHDLREDFKPLRDYVIRQVGDAP